MTAGVWRVEGDPLVAGSGAGPLTGQTVAVKDLYAVAGFPTGAGVPDFLAESVEAVEHAPAVAVLLAEGADVRGIAQTDQLAYSIAGANEHYPVPPNAAVPGAVPGGSSSGSASAVALGEASIGLGTDTAGSIRIPASYQGLWGLRTTHGAVSLAGVVPLAPSFDTVGWLTRSADTLAAVAQVCLDTVVPDLGGFVVAPALEAFYEPAVRVAFTDAVDSVGNAVSGSDESVEVGAVELPSIDAVFEAFRVVQAAEAWASHGAWVRSHPHSLLGSVRERFAVAAALTADEVDAARVALASYRSVLDDAIGDRVLLLPSAPSAAPSRAADPAAVDRVRGQTLRLTCLAGATGRPALSAPLLMTPDGPVGLCLVGPRHSDRALVPLATALALALR